MADILSDISQDPDITLNILGNYIGSAYSPQVEVTETETGHEVAITYDDATDGITTKTFSVEDGEDYVLTQADRTEIAGIVVNDLDSYIDAMEQATTRADSAERTRAAAESERNAAEQARQSAETGRDAAEGIRVQAEEQRASSERQRASSEQSRATAEQARVTAEQGRVTAEQARASAETARAGEWATLKADAVTATSAANSAASSASAAETDLRAAAARGDFDGYSPTVAIASTTDQHTVTITDADGPHSYTVPTYASEEAARAEEWADLKADAEEATEAAQEAATEVAPEVAWLWGNQLTGELTGDILTAADAYAAPPMALTVDGRSTQASTTGKNLFDKDNAPLGYYGSDGAFHSSGSGSSGYRWWSVPVSEGDVIRWADSMNNYLTGWNGGTFVQLAATRPTSPFTVPSGVDEVRGYTQNSTLDTCIVTKNNADLTYEPYTGGKPSPNPDYPQPIESVDELALAFAGRNMVKDSDREYSLTTSNCAEYDTAYMLTDATQFTISVDAVVPSGQTLYLYGYDGVNNNSFGTLQPLGNGRYSRLIEPTHSPVNFEQIKSVKQFRVYSQPYTGGTSVVTNVSNFTLVAGTDTEYIPSDITTVPIPLQDHVLRSLPDGTKDTLALTYLRPSTTDGWAVYGASLMQRLGYLADMGELAWRASAAREHGFYANVANIMPYRYASDTQALCTAFVYEPARSILTNMHDNMFSVFYSSALPNSATRELYAVDPSVTAAADFASSVAGESVVFELATPVTHDLGEIELPVLPAPTCTVWADPTTGLTMEYVRDSNLVVQSLSAETAIAYASIATVDGSTATASHATGTYLTMGGTLYKVTQAIAVGETIAAGTNVTQTTVMAELIARTA